MEGPSQDFVKINVDASFHESTKRLWVLFVETVHLMPDLLLLVRLGEGVSNAEAIGLSNAAHIAEQLGVGGVAQGF
jgi:hypothetical protein